MVRPRRPSAQTLLVLSALVNEAATWRYGYELGREVDLKAGSLYPILIRLCDRGLLEATWEDEPPAGRPPRHLYRLTTDGLRWAAEVATEPPSRDTTEPTRRDTTEPAQRGATEPARRGATEPARRGAAEPARRDTTKPTRRGATEPARRGATEPTLRGATEPASSGATVRPRLREA